MLLKCKQSKLTFTLFLCCEIVMFLVLSVITMNLKVIATAGTIMILLAIIALLLEFRSINGGVLYFLCLILMHCGQIFMIACSMQFPPILTTSIAIGDQYPYAFEAMRFTVVSCLFVALFILVMNGGDRKERNRIGHKASMITISYLGWLMVAGIAALALLSDVVRAKQVSEVGYAAGFQQHNVILYYADMLFPLFTYLVISTYRNNLKAMLITMVIVLARAGFSMFFIGSRGQAVLDIIIGYCSIITLTSNRRVKKTISIIFYAVACVGALVLPLTGLLRGDTPLTVESFFTVYNPIAYSLTEFGASIVNVRLAIPTHGNLALKEFFTHLLTLVPSSTNLFPFLIGTYGGNYALYLNTAGGDRLGGSVLGEAAFWFGDSAGGIIYIMIIVGILSACIGSLSKKESRRAIKNNAILMYLISCVFFQIRGTVSDLLAGIKIAVYFWIIFTMLEKYIFSEKATK